MAFAMAVLCVVAACTLLLNPMDDGGWGCLSLFLLGFALLCILGVEYG